MNNILVSTPHHPRGVPFIPFGLSTQSTEEIEQALARTDCSHLEAHCDDTSVLVGEAFAVGSLLAEANQRGERAFIIGFSARDHAEIGDQPVRSIYHQLEADATAAANDQSYQPRFLPPRELAGLLSAGLTSRLDPADYAHRLPELEAIAENPPAGESAARIQSFLRSAKAYASGAEHRHARPFVQVYTTNRALQAHGGEGLEIIVLACPFTDHEAEPAETRPTLPGCPLTSVAHAGQLHLSI